MRSLYPNAEIIRDIGGGLNWKRQGLLSILERIHRGDKLTLVVAHRDRLARFGFELIEWLVQQNGGQVLVLHQPDASPQSELTEDLLAVLHTFSCRMHGLRRYRTQSRRIQVYPNQLQKRAIASWLDASRWTYNLSVELRRAGAPAAWRTGQGCPNWTCPRSLAGKPLAGFRAHIPVLYGMVVYAIRTSTTDVKKTLGENWGVRVSGALSSLPD